MEELENKLGFLSTDSILAATGVDFDDPLPVVISNPTLVSKIHSWSNLNSLATCHQRPLTKVACPPLVAAPAHEFQTLLTVLKQAQGISACNYHG